MKLTNVFYELYHGLINKPTNLHIIGFIYSRNSHLAFFINWF